MKMLSALCILATACSLAAEFVDEQVERREECNPKIDLGFLLDGSGSVTAVNFQKMLQFTKALIEEFTISVSMTHSGVVVYGISASVSFDFNKYYDQKTMVTAVENIPYPNARDTKTGNGLTVTRNDLFQATGRTGVEQYLVVVTDGKSSDDVVAPSNQLKGDGVTIFSIGVGSSYNLNELNAMSSDPDSAYTLPLNSFDTLSSIVKTIKNRICKNFCEPNPCLNGGTCKNGENGFTCVCSYGYTGETCDKEELKRPTSCLDLRKQGIKTNGYYQIFDGTGQDPCEPTTVYCDMTSEPCMVWTLVESWTKGNRTLPAFQSAVYSVDSPINYDAPNWYAYRMTRYQMNRLKERSTHWRATCSFPDLGVDYRDYVRGNFKDFDIVNFIGNDQCKKVDYVNVRGHKSSNTEVPFWQTLGAYHLHIQSSGIHCRFKMNQGSVGSEDNFGYYGSPNLNFRCTANDANTTQWWFGASYPDFCHPNPCLNGGNCTNGKTNYTCNCPKGYTGDVCEHTKPRSCVDLRKQGITTNGIYEIYDEAGPDPCEPTKVYCDMTSESCMAWTLVESWSKGNKNLSPFKSGVFSDDSPLNYDNPNWLQYRMTHNQMDSLKSRSSHWRSTCSFPTHGVDHTDYVRGNFKDFDILTWLGGGICRPVDYVNIRGHKATHSQANFWQTKGSYHLHIESSAAHCPFKPYQGSVGSEDNFGFYLNPNPNFRCTASDSDTTQWWMGGYVDDKPKSCVDIRKQGFKTNGYYQVYLGASASPCQPTTVYCDMISEPCMAWTLVESWSFGNRSLAAFKSAVFSVDARVNFENPNWSAYRMTYTQMNLLKTRSTHWRSTCSFPKYGVDYTDYLRGNFEDFDIMTWTGGNICRPVDYVNVRGHSAKHTQANFWQTVGSYHLHIQSSDTHCSFKPNQGSVPSEDNFGFYGAPNPKFRCSASDADTTQWWFGGSYKD